MESIGNSIKGATVSGIKNGLKALVTSGGSAAVSALKGLAGSIIGINKSKPSIGQIDLKSIQIHKCNLKVNKQQLVGEVFRHFQ